MQHRIACYWIRTGKPIDRHLLLRFPQWVVEKSVVLDQKKQPLFLKSEAEIERVKPDKTYIATPGIFYKNFRFETITIPVAELFEFSQEVVARASQLFPNHAKTEEKEKNVEEESEENAQEKSEENAQEKSEENAQENKEENAQEKSEENVEENKEKKNPYTVVHLRMGDKFIVAKHKDCPNDTRKYNENHICNRVEELLAQEKTVLFLCDNAECKRKMKQKYANLSVTNSQIGHTSYAETSEQQVVDTLAEFYLITKAELVIMASYSGFSWLASLFHRIPLELLEPCRFQ